MVRHVPVALTAEEIRDANTRYHDVAAREYDAKWGIDFGAAGLEQVLAKVTRGDVVIASVGVADLLRGQRCGHVADHILARRVGGGIRAARPARGSAAARAHRRAHASGRAAGELLVSPPSRRLRVDRR